MFGPFRIVCKYEKLLLAVGIHSTNFACSKYHHLHLSFSGLHDGLHVINLNAPVHILSHYVGISWSRTRFFQVNLEFQWPHPLSWQIILIYWLCRQAVRRGSTQRRRNHSWQALTILSFFVAKVLTNQSAPFTKARFQNKNKRPRCIKDGPLNVVTINHGLLRRSKGRTPPPLPLYL